MAIMNTDNPYLYGTIWDYGQDPSLIGRVPFNIEPSQDDTYHQVVEGEELTQIAGKKEVYGNSNLWWLIWDNNDMESPWDLYPGQLLRIPPKTSIYLNGSR